MAFSQACSGLAGSLGRGLLLFLGTLSLQDLAGSLWAPGHCTTLVGSPQPAHALEVAPFTLLHGSLLMVLLHGQATGPSELDHQESIHMVTPCCGNIQQFSHALDLYVTYEHTQTNALFLGKNIWKERLLKTTWPWPGSSAGVSSPCARGSGSVPGQGTCRSRPVGA